jgi:5-oxoprolinase (ATP-hydrolysing)
MPPFSRTLEEEGACIKSFKLVENGNFQEKAVTEILNSPAKIKRDVHELPISGTRNLRDNLSDLKAQVAANHKGILLVKELIAHYSLEVVQAYMYHGNALPINEIYFPQVQNNAETAVRDMLVSISEQNKLKPIDSLYAEDFMDDGSRIVLKLTINRNNRSAIFDFTGTEYEVRGNTNAPVSVTKSAVIYCLRCLVNRDIPLNQGCLNPIEIIIPEGSFLCPSDTAAVVGGNVLTSQRVTDVILSAFKASANAQGEKKVRILCLIG